MRSVLSNAKRCDFFHAFDYFSGGRDAAAALLDVSPRQIDRYRASNKAPLPVRFMLYALSDHAANAAAADGMYTHQTYAAHLRHFRDEIARLTAQLAAVAVSGEGLRIGVVSEPVMAANDAPQITWSRS